VSVAWPRRYPIGVRHALSTVRSRAALLYFVMPRDAGL
jgi:hypothetical protein